VAQDINSTLLRLASAFNLDTRKSRAKAERQFVERRLEEVRTQLLAVEDRLQSFYQRNREYARSPALTFERDRLARDVEFARQLYVTLAQSVEQAKLEEVRDTPVITLIDQPSRPLRRDPRGTMRMTVLAFIAATVAGVFFVLFLDTIRGALGRDVVSPEKLSPAGRTPLALLRWPWR
jgi:uncharacterized protein involved in exopolysaccharide biosynthesis